MKYTVVVSLLLLFGLHLQAQVVSREMGNGDAFEEEYEVVSGSVHVYQPASLSLLLSKHVSANAKREGIKGWRVNIYFGSGRDARQRAMDIKQSFEEDYKEEGLKCYVEYQEPDYKINVGNFRADERIQAYKLMKHLSYKYPNAYIMEDMIEFPQLYKEELNEDKDLPVDDGKGH